MCDDDNIEAIEENQLEYWLGNRTQGQGYVLFYQARGITAEQLGLKVEKRKPNGVFEPVGEGVRYVDGYGQAPAMAPTASATRKNARTVDGVMEEEEEEEEFATSPGSISASVPGLRPFPLAPPIMSPTATSNGVGHRVDRQFGFNTPTNGVAHESTARPPLKKEPSDRKWYNRMSMSGISTSGKDKEKILNSKDKTVNGPYNGGTTSSSSRPSTAQTSISAVSNTASLDSGALPIQGAKSSGTGVSPNISSSMMSSTSAVSSSTGISSQPPLPAQPQTQSLPSIPNNTSTSNPRPIPSIPTQPVTPSPQPSTLSSLGRKPSSSAKERDRNISTGSSASYSGGTSLGRKLSGMGKLGRSGSMAFGKIGFGKKDGIQEEKKKEEQRGLLK